MGSRRRNKQLALNAEINVVSLIDVILLLLLIFMITAPMMTGGFEIELPKANAQEIESKDAVLVEITKEGTIHLDGKTVTIEVFETTIQAYLKGKQDATIRADTNVPFGVVAKVMSALRAAGAKGANIVTSPEAPKGG